MGCISSKSIPADGTPARPRERLSRRGSFNMGAPRVHSSRRREVVRSRDTSDSGDVKAMLIDKNTSTAYGSSRFHDRPAELNVEKSEVTAIGHPGSVRVPNAVVGEQVAAGWPSWLVMGAGEALNGWVPRRANTFEKLEKIGQGTYSSVFKARDIIHNRIVALKKVRFDHHDPESVKFMTREIIVLRRLDHPNVIKLEGLIASPTSCTLYLIFEYMEHDLVGIASLPGIKFSEAQVKCYMHQLLSGLDHCHSRNVLHRDIKGSNLLIDSNGILKIADFGLASFFDHHASVPMTSRVVTLWYRPPELLLGSSHYGVAVDLWSTGCILGELYAGKPILPGKTEVEQIHKIYKLCGSPSDNYWKKSKLRHSTVFKPIHPYKRCVAETFRDVPASAVGLLERLLSVDPAHRGTAASALKSEFFTTYPHACDPSSLPKYPPSKEFDVKLRDEEARRQRGSSRDERPDLERGGSKEVLESRANTAAATLLKRTQQRFDSKSRSEMLNSSKDGTTGNMIDPAKQALLAIDANRDMIGHQQRRVSHSGPLGHGNGWAKSRREQHDPELATSRPRLSILSGSLATRNSNSEDRPDGSFPPPVNQSHMREGSFNDFEYRGRQEIQRNVPGGERTSHKEQSLHGRGSGGNKIYVSGPLLVPSNNMDQMLKDHDRRIQEFARRARLEQRKHGKPSAPGAQQTTTQ